jgi:two-component system response regulator DegU
MIADDHAAFRQVAKTMLKPLGAEVLECQDGQEAVEQFAHARPDFVLMDVAMQPLDGLRATAQIKARFPEARIIILTQYDDADLRAAANQAGACAYLLKEDLSALPRIVQSASDL